MKSMKQMQSEILGKARWDGGWPRAVHVGMGVVALAKDQEHYNALVKSSMRANIWGVVIGIAASLAAVALAIAFAR